MCRHILVQLLNIKFNENPSSLSRVRTYVQTEKAILLSAPQRYELAQKNV
jgi:hypothetical protein